MEIRIPKINLLAIFILLFIVLTIFVVIAQTTEVCINDPGSPSGKKCFNQITEDDIRLFTEKYKNFEELQKQNPFLAEYILKNYKNKFFSELKNSESIEQVNFIYGTKDERNFLFTNVERTNFVNGLSPDQKQKFFTALVQNRLKELYPSYEINFNNFKLDNKEIKLVGWKLVTPNGGYINLAEGIDKLRATVTNIDYRDGNFILTFSNRIKIEYKQGSPTTDGGFLDEKGELVGGGRELNLLYEFEGQNKNKEITVAFVTDENGKKYTEFRLKGDEGSVGIRGIDIEGNDYFIGINNFENDENGNTYEAVIRIDQDGIIEAKSAVVKTQNFGEIKIDHDQFTILGGNVFDSPRIGVQSFQSRLMGLLLPETIKEITDKVNEIYLTQDTNSQTLKTKTELFRQAFESIITESLGNPGAETTKNIFLAAFPDLAKIYDQKVGQYIGGTEEIAKRLLTDLGVYSQKNFAGLLNGEGGLIGPAVSSSLSKTLEKFSSKSYESLEENKGLAYIDILHSDIDKNDYLDYISIGRSLTIDVTNAKGKIRTLAGSHTSDNSETGGVFFNNGGFLISFRNDKTYDVQGNDLDALRTPANLGKAKKTVEQIINLRNIDNDNYYVIDEGKGWNYFYKKDTRVTYHSGGQYVQITAGDAASQRKIPAFMIGSQVYVGGLTMENMPKSDLEYPDLANPSTMTLSLDVTTTQIPRGPLGRYLLTGRIGAPKFRQQVASEATISTSQFTNQIDDSVYQQISSIVEERHNGNVQAFYDEMNTLSSLIKQADAKDKTTSDNFLKWSFPNMPPQATRDLVYLITEPDAYRDMMSSYAQQDRYISSGSGTLSLSSDKGLLVGNNPAPNQDSRIASFLIYSANQHPPGTAVRSVTEAKNAGSGREVRNYNLRAYLDSRFSNYKQEVASQPAQTKYSGGESTQTRIYTPQKTYSQKVLRYYYKRGPLGNLRKYYYYAYE